MNQSDHHESSFINYLKSNGERITAPRLSIFRELRRHNPQSMRDLSARSKDNGIDTVTVYRTIGLFKRLRVVQEIGVGKHRLLELSDSYGTHHHHFWCTNCGKMVDFDNDTFEEALTSIAMNLGISVSSHQLEVIGTCKECLRAEPRP